MKGHGGLVGACELRVAMPRVCPYVLFNVFFQSDQYLSDQSNTVPESFSFLPQFLKSINYSKFYDQVEKFRVNMHTT